MLNLLDRCTALSVLLVGVIIALVGTPAAAQTSYTISGQVLDATNAEPLPGANVQIAGTTYGTAAARDGGFAFEAQLEPGEYRVRVSFVGFETVTRPVDLGDQQRVTLDPVRMNISASRVEEGGVTG